MAVGWKLVVVVVIPFVQGHGIPVTPIPCTAYITSQIWYQPAQRVIGQIPPETTREPNYPVLPEYYQSNESDEFSRKLNEYLDLVM